MSTDRNRLIAETLEPDPSNFAWPANGNYCDKISNGGEGFWCSGDGVPEPLDFSKDSAAHVALVNFVTSDRMPEEWRIDGIDFLVDEDGTWRAFLSNDGNYMASGDGSAPNHMIAFRDAVHEIVIRRRGGEDG